MLSPIFILLTKRLEKGSIEKLIGSSNSDLRDFFLFGLICFGLLFISTDPQCSQECGPDASCTEYSGSWQCVCNPGFQGDGLSCQRKFALALNRPRDKIYIFLLVENKSNELTVHNVDKSSQTY